MFVNEANALGQTALHVAAQRGHRSVVEFLLDQDALVNVENRLRQTPLHLACQYNHQNVRDGRDGVVVFLSMLGV